MRTTGIKTTPVFGSNANISNESCAPPPTKIANLLFSPGPLTSNFTSEQPINFRCDESGEIMYEAF